MAIADMFLKIPGVTGESGDAKHKGEIQVVSWSWGLASPAVLMSGPTRRTSADELEITKHVDRASPTLASYLNNNKIIDSGVVLTVRKAGASPLEYLTLELEKVRITSFKLVTEEADVTERVRFAFQKITVNYLPQDPTGAVGGGAVTFTYQSAPG